MSLSWPRSRQMSRIMRRSNTRAVWSRADVARHMPRTRSNNVLVMVFLWPWRVVRHRPFRGSQSLTRWSLEPDTMRPFEGCQSQLLASQPWPDRVVFFFVAVLSFFLCVVLFVAVFFLVFV